MDTPTQTMIENLRKNTGKTLEQWIDIIRNERFDTEVLDWIKASYENAG